MLASYSAVRSYDFINFDDPQYVAANPAVRGGLTPAAIGWAFTSGHAGNWHPLTWLSHMADVEMHGLDPGAHHVTNVLIHTANTILLFILLVQLTGAAGRSAFVAALFGLHPLHVESVAWIAERKDVLSTFFWIAATMAYAGYVRRPSGRRYAATAALFACGLMSKPTVVTLPLTLLLLDYWPLQRAGVRRLILEKVPLLAMSLAAGAITLAVQREAGAVSSFDVLPFTVRLQNAALAYVAYLWKMIWPVDLAPLYPYSLSLAYAAVAGAVLLLAALTVLALRVRRQAPYVSVGWAWYVITLLPMIGLVQVGSQPMADRYTYVPLIGIFIAIAWGAHALAARLAVPARAIGVAAVSVVAVMAVMTFRQTAVWRDSLTLWTHTIDATGPNARAQTNIGQALGLQGRFQEALPHLEEAVRIRDTSAQAHYHLAQTLSALGHPDSALTHYRRAVDLNPNIADAQGSLGVALAQAGLPEEGLGHMRDAARLAPDSAPARANLVIGLNHAAGFHAQKGDYRKAAAYLEESIALDPSMAEAHANLGAVRALLGDLDGALTAYREAQRLEPASPVLQHRIDQLLRQRGGQAPR